MRVDVDVDGPRPDVIVLLNGEEIHEVFVADEERGLVVVADRDESGRLQVDYKLRQVKRREVFGDVKIVFRESFH